MEQSDVCRQNAENCSECVAAPEFGRFRKPHGSHWRQEQDWLDGEAVIHKVVDGRMVLKNAK